MKRIRTVALAAALVAMAAAPASAHGPTCADFAVLGVEVHGQHVIRDYVVGESGTLSGWPPGGSVGSQIGGSGAWLPGGPGPAFHFANGFAPGASFCNSQSKSPGFHVE